MSNLTTEGYADLLRIERGRTQHREIFGAMRLHYGFFKLQATNSHYLLAKRDGSLIGAVGYTIDPIDKDMRIFELIALDDEVIHPLLTELLRLAKEELGICYIEANVSAYSPRMQRTLLELGFLPAAYVPALAFYDVERLDILKMVKLNTHLDTSHDKILPEAEKIADIVIRNFRSLDISEQILDAIDHANLFLDMNKEQQRRLASYCSIKEYGAGEELFVEGTEDGTIYLVLSGEIEIIQSGSRIGKINEGETVGEISALSRLSHSATAKAMSNASAVILQRNDLENLIRLRPDIGVAIYKNLAHGLGKKLLRADKQLAQETGTR